MAAIQELLNQIQDDELRLRIEKEVEKLTKTKKFGLVFEEHLPECTPLYDIPVKRGSIVALKNGTISEMYLVTTIKDSVATCVNKVTKVAEDIPVQELVTVAQFGEPIYPYLKTIDSVCNAKNSDLWHTLIEADNYHALQLLEYLYAGKVDCIYIDPPYNTGARDWKYNNNYVDSADAYRHSKWLSMIEKRLKIAKKLLNPRESVLIVTIDEKEFLHLGCLLEELFPESNIQMITIVHNPGGAIRVDALNRVNEYAFYVFIGNAKPSKSPIVFLPSATKGINHTEEKRSPIWRGLLRGGSNPLRSDSPSKFYPILVDRKGKVIGAGDPLPLGVSRESYVAPENVFACWPIKSDGIEGRWEVNKSTFEERLKLGYIKAGELRKDGTRTIYYLRNAEIERIQTGELVNSGMNNLGYLNLEYNDAIERSTFPKTVWNNPLHNATEYGSNLLSNMIGRGKFSFPKSLYAVVDSLSFIVGKKKDALIVDFFAGSGTTLHAVNLLNAQDNGQRRCIMVTNNEVSDSEGEILRKSGITPGDEEWEKLGIARSVTWPRTICSILGRDIFGNKLKGYYQNCNLSMAEGFKSNVIFFKLGFLDNTAIALGRQLEELLPVLWLKAGAYATCPCSSDCSKPMLVLPKNRFAILIDEKYYQEFCDKVKEHNEIQTLFIVTDSESGYKEMISGFNNMETYQLYRDYLDNFRINVRRT